MPPSHSISGTSAATRSRARALGRRALYPLFVFGRGAILIWLCLSFGPAVPPIVIGFTVASVLLLLLAERWIPHREAWSTGGDREIPSDLGHSLAYLAVGGRLAQLVFIGGAMAAFGPEGKPWPGIWPVDWPEPAQIALVVFLGDGLEYAYHRASHRLTWLWRLHALHHKPRRLHVVKNYRHHWLYGMLRGLFVLLPLLLVGAPLEMLLWVPIGLMIVGVLAHANVDLRLPRWAHRLLITPDVHRIHHSSALAQQTSNFCSVFPFWDLLFGTFRDPEREAVAATGIEDDPVPDSFLAQLVLPLRLSGRR